MIQNAGNAGVAMDHHPVAHAELLRHDAHALPVGLHEMLDSVRGGVIANSNLVTEALQEVPNDAARLVTVRARVPGTDIHSQWRVILPAVRCAPIADPAGGIRQAAGWLLRRFRLKA